MPQGFPGRIVALCSAAADDSLIYSNHYIQQQLKRPTPSKAHIKFMLCRDSPEVIEDYPNEGRGSCCLIWGIADHNGRIGHVVCANPPEPKVITAYFPEETESSKWENNFRTRRDR